MGPGAGAGVGTPATNGPTATASGNRPPVTDTFLPGPGFAENGELLNPGGAVHGGILTTMAGLASQQAMLDSVDYDLQSLRVLFLRPAQGPCRHASACGMRAARCASSRSNYSGPASGPVVCPVKQPGPSCRPPRSSGSPAEHLTSTSQNAPLNLRDRGSTGRFRPQVSEEDQAACLACLESLPRSRPRSFSGVPSMAWTMTSSASTTETSRTMATSAARISTASR